MKFTSLLKLYLPSSSMARSFKSKHNSLPQLLDHPPKFEFPQIRAWNKIV